MSNSLGRVSCFLSKVSPKHVPVLSRMLSDKIIDVPTHTGQCWEADDYRLVRFINSTKQVNKNWAVKLIAEVPPTEVTERIVWCDGGSGPEGHPRVYINLDKPKVMQSCDYCGLRFIRKEHCH